VLPISSDEELCERCPNFPDIGVSHFFDKNIQALERRGCSGFSIHALLGDVIFHNPLVFVSVVCRLIWFSVIASASTVLSCFGYSGSAGLALLRRKQQKTPVAPMGAMKAITHSTTMAAIVYGDLLVLEVVLGKLVCGAPGTASGIVDKAVPGREWIFVVFEGRVSVACKASLFSVGELSAIGTAVPDRSVALVSAPVG
jgi:hypothetical protein